MNFIDNQQISKEKMKQSFLTFFKTQDVSHLAGKKLKEIKQILGKIV
jgi:hypothetical protein